MKNDNIYNMWTNIRNNYEYYFLSNEELWNISLNKVINYIENNKRLPSSIDTNKHVRILSKWIGHQQTNYIKKTQSMKQDIIYNKWTEFITNYKEYFESYEERWIKYLEKVKNYIDSHKKRPSQYDIIKDVGFLGRWIITQKSNYNKKKDTMKNKEIYDKWINFINDPNYKVYFK